MVFFNYALRKLNAKIVYYGPGLCGKTTNLQWIHDHFDGGQRGKMISLATEGDRTIFFDLLPIELGKIRGMDVTLQLYTVPGQVHYNSTRQLVLRGADGVVFVADSQRTMQTSNRDSIKNLQENLLLQGITLEGFPLALQFNKRDLGDLIPTEELNDQLNVYSVPIFEAIATDGVGVQETLEGITKLVMRSLRERYDPGASTRASSAGERSSGPRPAAKPTMPPAIAPPTPPAPKITPPTPAPPTPASQAPVSSRLATPQSPGQGTPPPAQGAGPVPPPAASSPEFAKPIDFGSAQLVGEQESPKFEDHVDTAVYGLDEDPLDSGDNVIVDELSQPPVDDLGPPTGGSGEGALSADLEPPAVTPGAEVSYEPFADAETDTGMEVPEIGEIVIGAEDGELSAPDSDLFVDDQAVAELPGAGQPVDQSYTDRIEAPSPFAPQSETPAEAPPIENIGAATVGLSADEVTQGVLQAFGAGENTEALASLVQDEVQSAVSAEVEATVHQPPATEAVMVGEGDPFDQLRGDSPAEFGSSIVGSRRRSIDVRAEDNQLQIGLKGSGAIVESGQVRALDIEVPVPGSWVGNRRVTLQLRLTLSPVSEDEDGESADPS